MVKSSKQNNNSNTNNVCLLCESVTVSTIEEFWSALSDKKKLSILQADKNDIMRQIRKNSLLKKNNSSCMCAQCKKQQRIVTTVIKVFEDFLQELEICPAQRDKVNQVSISRTKNQFSNKKAKLFAEELERLPLENYLVIQDGKLMFTEDYLTTHPHHFLSLLKRCSTVFEEDNHLSPSELPSPDNIHTLINFCTVNTELNIKKLMLQQARKALEEEEKNSTNGNSSSAAALAAVAAELDSSSDEESDERKKKCKEQVVSKSVSGGITTTVIEKTTHEEISIQGTTEVVGMKESILSQRVVVTKDKSSRIIYCRGEVTTTSTADMNNCVDEVINANIPESRILFLIYLVRLFCHNLRIAFKETVAYQNQKKLLEEYDNAQRVKKAKKVKKQQQKVLAAEEDDEVEIEEQEEQEKPSGDLHDANDESLGQNADEIEENSEWNVVEYKPKGSRKQKQKRQEDQALTDIVRSPTPSIIPKPMPIVTSTPGGSGNGAQKKTEKVSPRQAGVETLEVSTPQRPTPSPLQTFNKQNDANVNAKSAPASSRLSPIGKHPAVVPSHAPQQEQVPSMLQGIPVNTLLNFLNTHNLFMEQSACYVNTALPRQPFSLPFPTASYSNPQYDPYGSVPSPPRIMPFDVVVGSQRAVSNPDSAKQTDYHNPFSLPSIFHHVLSI